ncbi:hypothetical protein PTTG_07035, partial [Puccinia triticina 1-1 BBBD Race 1]
MPSAPRPLPATPSSQLRQSSGSFDYVTIVAVNPRQTQHLYCVIPNTASLNPAVEQGTFFRVYTAFGWRSVCRLSMYFPFRKKYVVVGSTAEVTEMPLLIAGCLGGWPADDARPWVRTQIAGPPLALQSVPNCARNWAARGPEARPFVVDPAAAARVASSTEPARPDSEVRAPSPPQTPPGLEGLRPRSEDLFVALTPEAAGNPLASPVFRHQTPNPGPLPGSPVFPPATNSDRDEAMTKSATSSGGTSRFDGWGSGVPAGIVQSPTWNPIPEASRATTSDLHADEVTDSDGDVRMTDSHHVPLPDVPGEYCLAGYPFL